MPGSPPCNRNCARRRRRLLPGIEGRAPAGRVVSRSGPAACSRCPGRPALQQSSQLVQPFPPARCLSKEDRHAHETTASGARGHRRSRAGGRRCDARGGGPARHGGRDAETAQVGRAAAGAPGARRPRRGAVHDRGARVDRLEVPPRPAPHADLGLLVREPAGRPPVPGSDDRGHAPDERRDRHVRDRGVAQRPARGVPAERRHPRGSRAARRDPPASSPTCTAARTTPSSTGPRCSGSRATARRARTTSRTRTPITTSSARRWSGTTTTRSGNTRTNVYAGLAGAYLIRDDQDTGEPGNPLDLPRRRRTRSRSCCRTRRSTPTGACTTRVSA